MRSSIGHEKHGFEICVRVTRSTTTPGMHHNRPEADGIVTLPYHSEVSHLRSSTGPKRLAQHMQIILLLIGKVVCVL